jgi:hypothetical protein
MLNPFCCGFLRLWILGGGWCIKLQVASVISMAYFVCRRASGRHARFPNPCSMNTEEGIAREIHDFRNAFFEAQFCGDFVKRGCG